MLPADNAARRGFAVTFLPDTFGRWHLFAGRRAIAAFATRDEAADFARDLCQRGLAVTILFGDSAEPLAR